MRFMNPYDIEHARMRFGRGYTPNRLALAIVVDQLHHWANSNSDGWAHWPLPARAADQAMALIESTTNRANTIQEDHDISEDTMQRAVLPIEAFLAHRANVDEIELIMRAVRS